MVATKGRITAREETMSVEVAPLCIFQLSRYEYMYIVP
jgi:hypothetical protein